VPTNADNTPIRVTKHAEVRRDAEEVAKLMMIQVDLNDSKELIEVDKISE